MVNFAGIRDTWRLTTAQEADHLGDRDNYQPEYWSIHYGGGGFYRTDTWDDLEWLLRRWWGFHTRVVDGRQVMSDIAYNYSAPPRDGSTDSMRLRGERPNGGQRNSKIWGPRTRTYVFPIGPRGPVEPSENQLRAFARMWAQDPLPVRYHRWFPDQGTVCPGDGMVQLIEDEFWLDYLEDPMSQRLAGARAADTAALGSQFVFQTASKVYIANRGSAPDIGVASAVAAQMGDGPILYVDTDRVPDETAAEILRLGIQGTDNVIIVGGTTVVSAAVEAALDQLVT